MDVIRQREDFPTRLRNARQGAGFTVPQLASKIISTRKSSQTDQYEPIGASTIRAYESGQTRASIPIIKQIAEKLGKPMSFFCEGSISPDAESSLQNSSEIAEIREELQKLKIGHFDLIQKFGQLAKEVEILKGNQKNRS